MGKRWLLLGGRCLRKVLLLAVSIWVLSFAVFFIARFAPGDPLASYYGERAERMGEREREWTVERLGLNEPVPVQYVRWILNVLHGDFGISYKYKRSVTAVIGERIGNTLLLGGVGFVLVFAGALVLGGLCARFEGRLPDKLLCRCGTLLSCIPEFWLSLVLILVFAVWLKVLPSSGAYTVGKDSVPDRAKHLILPLAVVVLGHLWYYAFMVRNGLLDEVRKDYVLLAKSKGLSRGYILFLHCLRNVLPAYLGVMAASVPHILGGTYIVETVFSYPGIGTLMYESARYKDYNLLMVLSILSGTVVIVCSQLAQAVNERIDPRMGRER